MQFVTDLQCDLVIRGWTRTYVRLSAPFGGHDSASRFWGAPTGFESDGASFPHWLVYVPALIGLIVTALCALSPLQTFLLISFLHLFVGFPLNATYLEAAVLHDVAYAEQARPRSVCDWMFFEAICERARLLWLAERRVASAVTYLRAPVMYAGVRAGGWEPWRQHRLRLEGANDGGRE